MNSYCTLYIVRHGETEWNLKKIIQGHLDSPLTKNGIAQARETARKLRNVHFDAIFSSDSKRAHNTAKILNEERNLAIKTTHLLRERDYGKYSGKEYPIFQNELKEYYKEFDALTEEGKWKYKFPTMESDWKMVERFIRFIRETSVAHPGKTVLIATHAGLIGNLLVHMGIWKYEARFNNRIDNAAYLKLKYDGVDFFIEEADGIDLAHKS